MTSKTIVSYSYIIYLAFRWQISRKIDVETVILTTRVTYQLCWWETQCRDLILMLKTFQILIIWTLADDKRWEISVCEFRLATAQITSWPKWMKIEINGQRYTIATNVFLTHLYNFFRLGIFNLIQWNTIFLFN